MLSTPVIPPPTKPFPEPRLSFPLGAGGKSDKPTGGIAASAPVPAGRLRNIPEVAERLHSQAYCGQGAIIGMRLDGKAIMIIPMRCKSWDCPTCCQRKVWALQTRIANGRPTKFITLTCRPFKDEDSRHQLLRLKKAFPKLVQRIRRVYGQFEYALTWELTKKGIAHCHIACRCKYIPQKWLSDAWHELTGAFRVDIRVIKQQEKAAIYLTKYLMKDHARTARILSGARLYQFSKGYDISEHARDGEKSNHVWVWTHSFQNAHDLLMDLPPEFLWWDIHLHSGGAVELQEAGVLARPPPCVEDASAGKNQSVLGAYFRELERKVVDFYQKNPDYEPIDY